MVLKKRILPFLALLICATHLFAANVPQLQGRVNDYANVISQRDEQQITEYLAGLEQSTGIQIAVLTIPSLQGEDIASYAIKVCDKWQLGKKGQDNGALLLLAMNERQVRIEVGYGLEDKLTDAKCGLIIRNVIIPEFRDGNYGAGMYKGVRNMGGIASDNAEIVSNRVLNEENSEDSIFGLIFMIIWIVIFFSVLTSKGGIFKWIFLNNMLNNGRHYHNHSSFHHTSGGFGGGFGGGGFHGGGGHFGGGGASGRF